MSSARAPNPIPRVYVDANVFILAYESVGPEALHAFAILEAIESGTIYGVTSELTLGEVLPGPFDANDAELAEAYQNILTNGPDLTMVPVTRDILVSSAELRAGKPGLKLQDAIHCASALIADCDYLVSDDRRIPKALGFTVVRFGPDSLTAILGPSV